MNQKSLLTEKENPQMDQESIKLDVSRKKSFEGGGVHILQVEQTNYANTCTIHMVHAFHFDIKIYTQYALPLK